MITSFYIVGKIIEVLRSVSLGSILEAICMDGYLISAILLVVNRKTVFRKIKHFMSRG